MVMAKEIDLTKGLQRLIDDLKVVEREFIISDYPNLQFFIMDIINFITNLDYLNSFNVFHNLKPTWIHSLKGANIKIEQTEGGIIVRIIIDEDSSAKGNIAPEIGL
jgi:hypothetical protein